MENLHNFEYLKLFKELCNNKINFYSNFIKYVNDKKVSVILNLSGNYSKLKDNIKKLIYIKNAKNKKPRRNNHCPICIII